MTQVARRDFDKMVRNITRVYEPITGSGPAPPAEVGVQEVHHPRAQAKPPE
jgi:hypothetical protein